jgi:hypothetical protein
MTVHTFLPHIIGIPTHYPSTGKVNYPEDLHHNHHSYNNLKSHMQNLSVSMTDGVLVKKIMNHSLQVLNSCANEDNTIISVKNYAPIFFPTTEQCRVQSDN